jgi:hypothetical protein
VINLRQAITPLKININNRPLELAEQADIANSSQFGRGWASAAMNEQGAELMWQSNQAAIAGDVAQAQGLRQQGEDVMRRAQTWAPTVQNFTDIGGVGDAVDWAAGAAGNIRSSVAPALGGLAGGVIGGLGGLALGGPGGAAAGATWGARAGAGLAGYNTMTEGNAAQAMMDPTIAATRTPEEIRDVSRLTGGAQGILEAVVPAGMAASVVKGGGKAATKELAEQGVKRYVGGKVAREAGEEFLTEFAQNPIGDMGQNYLAGEPMGDIDWKAAFNAGMAGAVGGGMMGGVGATADVMHDKLGGAAQVVGDVARDPVGAVIDKMKSGAEAAGRDMVGQDPARDREMAERAADKYFGPRDEAGTLRSFEERAKAQRQDEIFTSAPDSNLPDEQVSAQMRSEADRWAEKVLTSPARTYGAHESKLREAAATYKSNGDWLGFRNVLKEYGLRKEQDDMSASFEKDGAKFSEMSDEGKELNSLSDAWLSNEGKRFGHYFDDSNEAKGLGAKLFGWIKSDFGKQYNDGEMFIPKAFVDALGERAPGVIESAITAARKEGWDIKDAGDAVKTLRDYVTSNEGDVGFLKGALKYSQEKNWTPKMMQQFSKELRQKQGQLDKEDYKWLKSQVTDPAAVVEHFRQPSKFYKADKNQLLRSGSPKTQADMDVDGESLELSVDRDGEVVSESSTASAGITDNDGDWGSSVSEFDGDSKPTFIGNTLEGYPFDTTDERQVAKKNAKLGEYANDPAAFAREVGVWQQAKRAAKGNEALLAEYEDALIREHGNSLSDARFEGELNPVDLNEDERKSILGQINKRFRMVEVETTKSANDMAFDKKDVHLEKADPRDQELGPSKGVLRFQRYNKDGSPIARPFMTSTQMLAAKMFKSKDSMTGSTKHYEGTAQQLLQHLSDGVATLLQDPSFGGEGRPAKIAFTVKADGTPRWVDAKDIKSWPKNLVLFRDKEGRQYTLGEALAQIEEQAKKSPKEMRNELRTIDWSSLRMLYEQDELSAGRPAKEAKQIAISKVKEERATVAEAIEGHNDNLVRELYKEYGWLMPTVPSFTLDFDPDTLNPHNKLTIKEKKPWEKVEDLKQLLDLSTDKELRGRIVRAVKLAGKREFADSNALWKELVDSGKLQAAGIVTDVEVGRGNQVEEGLVGPDDLSAYDPDYIKRDERGAMRSKSIEYEAQSVIGTPKKVDPKDAGKFDPALKGFPTLTSTDAQNLAAEKLQAAKDWVTSVMRGEVEPLLSAIAKMDLQQVRITDAALFGRETVTERKGRVSDPDVSVKKANAAEIAALAKRVGVSRKVALAMLRRGDKTVHTRAYDKDGVRTKVTGEEHTVTKQVGLLDLHQTKLAKDYFNGSLREALAFLKTGRENVATLRGAIDDRKDDIRRSEAAVEGARDRAPDTRGQTDARGSEARVVAPSGRQRTAENSELDASQQGRKSENGVADLERHQMAKAVEPSSLPPNTPLWAVYEHQDDGEAGAFIAAFKDMGAAQWLAENKGYTLVNELAGELAKVKKESGAPTKQDAWVMKIANMSMKDMKAYINTLPKEKLKSAFDVLDSFYPVNSSNPFWQRNNLDNYADKMDKVVFEAQDLIRDRLDEYAKYSEQNTGEANDQLDGQNEQAEGRGAESSREGGSAAGVDGGPVVERTRAFFRRIADVSNTYFARLEKATDPIRHDSKISAFNGYRTEAAYVPELNQFVMFVLDSRGEKELQAYLKDAKNANIPMTTQLKNRLLGYIAIQRLSYDFSDNSFAMFTADKGSVGEKIVSDAGVLGETSDMNGQLLNKIDLKGGEITELFGELHARLKKFNGDEEVDVNWVRFTGAKKGKSGKGLFSEQSAADTLNADEAVAYLKRIFGKDFDAEVVSSLGGKAGQWTPHGIKLAASAPNGVQYHEALHEFFSQLRKHGSESVAELIQRVAQNPIMMRKLEQQLEGHQKALDQLKNPEEAAAFLFQFWNMGLINIGPETKSLFQTIKDFIAKAAKKLLSYVDTEFREQYNAEKRADKDQATALLAFETLNSGLVADPSRRHEVYDALRKNVEAHNKAMDDLGSGVEKFWQAIGQVVVSNEAMLGLYKKHPELQKLAGKFHQTHGKAMTNQGRDGGPEARGGYLEATHTQSGLWLNKLENMFEGYDQKDMEAALKYLEEGTGNSADKKIAKLVDNIRSFYSEMYDYTVQSDVRRLDPTSEERWVSVEKRKDYFTQVWDTESVMDGHDKFIEKLLTIHAKELKHMADQANAEIAAWNKDRSKIPTSPTAKAMLEKQEKAFADSGKVVAKSEPLQNVTPELIAENIYTRLLNSAGLLDMHESEWSMGITPGASAVNRRELNWLDKEAFSEFKSKDLVNITTTYARSMVKRAEYQKRFGYGGELIGNAVDTAFLREVGGNELVEESRASLVDAIKTWKKEAAAWHKDNQGVPYPHPYPTLRMVGIEIHRSKVGADESNAALIKAEKALRPAVNAIKGMEGTLGADISPAMRNFNSWITSYQNVRLLPFMLFTNLSDVIGITIQGGTLGDAWNAFVEGIREIRATWKGEKSTTELQRRAQEWGVVDAGALLDSLGQAYGSVFMSQKAKKFNDKFFRVIGAEGWNRGIRAAASSVGERIILDWVNGGVDFKKPGEKERFERLYGEGATAKSIKLDSSGNLDVNDAANRAAINRFVTDAIMTSNAAHRTAWMSNPKFATFSHLKNFAYTFHRVMLMNVLDQARLGNFRPALVASLGYAPIAIAAGALKEMLIPGEEPPWMQGGLDGYLEYGYGQANLGGVAQLWGESITDFDPAKVAGPFWDQIQNTITSPLPGVSLNLSPFDGETELLRDREWDVELAKALPAGNVLSRAFKG